MSDPTTFERRLADAFTRYADTAVLDVDIDEIATTMVALTLRSPRRDGVVAGLASRWPRRTLVTVGLLVTLLAAVLAAALIVGSHRRVPLPFGPAANGLIAFDSGGDMYVGDPVTGQSHLVLGGPGTQSDPAFSPDGSHLALIQSTSVSGKDDVVVVGVDGSNPTVVTPRPLTNLTWLDWTPDSRQVVLVAAVGGHQGLLLADATGAGIRTLVNDVDVDIPVFRPPDGGEIMFRADTPNGSGIFVVDADGSHRRALIAPAATTNPQFDLRSPQYSPDGGRIAYMAWDDVRRVMRIFAMNADGSGAHQLASDPQAWFEGWPIWSPDGTRLIETRQFYDGSGHPLDNTRPYAVAWVDGRTPAVETGPPMTTGFQHAAWSPDGTEILVQGNDQQLILDPSGGPWHATPWTSNAYPAWQRDAPR
jgi:hypothetical protein